MLISFGVLWSARGDKANIICDPDCRDYSVKCPKKAQCLTKWAKHNCKVTCTQCTPCEEFFATNLELEQFENRTREELKRYSDNLEAQIKELTQHMRLLLRGTRIIPISGHSLYDLKVSHIKEGKYEYIYDNDDSTCVTIENNKEYDYSLLHFSKPVHVSHVMLKWYGYHGTRSENFHHTLLSIDSCTDHPTAEGCEEAGNCLWDREGSSTEWFRFTCDNEVAHKLQLAFSYGTKYDETAQICGITVYGHD